MNTPTVLALDIGGTKIATGVVELTSPPRVAARRKVPTGASRGGAAVLETVKTLALEMLAHADPPVVALGVGAAGVIDPNTGAIVSATDLIPEWAGTQLATELHQATELPVTVVGDVVAHALGEGRFGAGAAFGSCVAVALGTGIGGALVEAGRISPGAHGVAGHVGHIQVSGAEDLVCSCGRKGHLEPIASGTGIAARYLALTGTEASGRAVEDLAQAGDSTALQVTTSAGFALGQALGSLANAMDPEAIILSGSVTLSGEQWWDSVHRGYADQAMDPVAGTPILVGQLGDDAPLLGAASQAFAALNQEGSDEGGKGGNAA